MEDVDPLGTRPTVVQIEDLTRWNLTALLETRENDNNSEDFHPFPWRNDLNAKIILWYVIDAMGEIKILVSR